MKIILLKTVAKLGKKDEIVEVADGYAHNALFPHKLAIAATEQAVKSLRMRQAGIVAEKNIQHELLRKTIQDLKQHTLTMKARVNERGVLFAKITATDIASFLQKTANVNLHATLIGLKDPIKQIGTYIVPIGDSSLEENITVTVEGL